MSTAQAAYEETIKQLQDYVSKHGDSFHIKVLRRNTEGDPLAAQFAAFNQATLEQIMNREEWLPMLVGPEGGGVFDIHVYDDTKTKPLVMTPTIRMRVDGPATSQTPNILACADSKTWRGPRVLTFPDPRTMRLQQTPATSVVSQPSTPQVTLQDARNAALAQPSVGAAANPTADAASARLLEAASQLAKQREELAEERHRLELQKIRSETDLRMQQLKMEMQSTQQVKSSGGDLMEKLPGLITAIGGILTPILVGISETRKEQNRQLIEAQKDAAQAARDAAKLSVEMQEKQFSALRETVEKIAEKRDDGSGQVYKQMSEAMMSMAGTTMQIVHQMAELPQGEPAEPGWVKAITSISDTIRDVATKVVEVNGARPMPPLPPRALPPATPAAQEPRAVTPAAAVQPTPAPQATPAKQSAPNEVDVLEGMIREKYPIEQVRDYFFAVLPKADMAAELAKYDSDLEKLIQGRLGVWLLNPENAKYVEDLGNQITAKGIELGLINPKTADEAPVKDATVEENASGDDDAGEEEEEEESEDAVAAKDA